MAVRSRRGSRACSIGSGSAGARSTPSSSRTALRSLRRAARALSVRAAGSRCATCSRTRIPTRTRRSRSFATRSSPARDAGSSTYRDTDDPCGDGRARRARSRCAAARDCSLLRPDPRGEGPNNRSRRREAGRAGLRGFTMWLAGDAEQQAISWFDATDYDRARDARDGAQGRPPRQLRRDFAAVSRSRSARDRGRCRSPARTTTATCTRRRSTCSRRDGFRGTAPIRTGRSRSRFRDTTASTVCPLSAAARACAGRATDPRGTVETTSHVHEGVRRSDQCRRSRPVAHFAAARPSARRRAGSRRGPPRS